MTFVKDQTNSPQSLEDCLDRLASDWIVRGEQALTAHTIDELNSLAKQDSRYQALAQRTQVLLEEMRQGCPLWGDDPITMLRSLLPNDDKPVTVAPVTNALAFDEDPEMLAGFVTEAEEHLNAIEEQILALEHDPHIMEMVHAVFRGFHTIKGLAGFLALTDVQSVAHEVETLLDHARNGRVVISPEIVDMVLESAEYLRHETACVQAKVNGTPAPQHLDNTELLKLIARVTESSINGNQPQEDRGSSLGEDSGIEVKEREDGVTLHPARRETTISCVPDEDRKTKHTEIASSSIRIETSKLDRLMDLVGEMVIAQSILTNNPNIRRKLDARLAGDLSQLARITSEVQRRAMSMRMMPIRPLFQKNAKLVRDLSRRHGKQVELEILGEGTELDKSIAEELSDPLLHMVRNALDHGIETPDERISKGKLGCANLRLSAEHQAGQIVIAISDDGRGLDPVRILRKAVEKGLVEENAQLAQNEIFQLIFAPGFSTAEKVTDISGRGVGMDVVRKHVENLRGKIQIRSELGQGTTFSIHLPLTLAIIEGLVIVVGTHRYIIPIFSIREMFRPTAEMISTVQGREEMVLMRGELLPLIRLHKRFNIAPLTEDICQGLLVVCEFSDKLFCLFVDDLLGRQEVVIKSLGSTFSETLGLSGCAILGDGQIGLILDVGGIYRMSNKGSKERPAA